MTMTSSGQENAQRTLPVLCANACGFYGSPTTKNLCSKCYREWVGSGVDTTATPVNTAVTTNNTGSPVLAPMSSASPSSSSVRLGDVGGGNSTGAALPISANTGMAAVRTLASSSFPPSMQQIEKCKVSNAPVVVGLGSATAGAACGGAGKSVTSTPSTARFVPPLGSGTQSGGAALGNCFVAHTSPPSLSVLPAVPAGGTTGGAASTNLRRRAEENGASTSRPEELQQDSVSAVVESNVGLDSGSKNASGSAVSQQHCRRSGRSCYLIEPGHHSRPASLSAVTATVAPTLATLEADGASQQLFHPHHHHHHHHHPAHHRSSRMGGGCGSSDLLLPCCSSASPCSVGGGFDGVGDESGGALGSTGPLAAAGAPGEDCTRAASRAGSLGTLSTLAPLPQQPQVELDAAPVRASEREDDVLLEDLTSVGTEGVSCRWKASTTASMLTGLPGPISGLSNCAPVAEKDNHEEDIVMAARDSVSEDEHQSTAGSGVEVVRTKRVEENGHSGGSNEPATRCDEQQKNSTSGSCVSLSTSSIQPVPKEFRCKSSEGVLVEESSTPVALDRKPSVSAVAEEAVVVNLPAVLPSASTQDFPQICRSETLSPAAVSPAPEPQGSTPTATSDTSPLEGKPVQKNKNRCFRCNKKVGLLGFQCRCEYFFCGTHRHADCHNCIFDYKTFGREQLSKANQKVVADKLSNRI